MVDLDRVRSNLSSDNVSQMVQTALSILDDVEQFLASEPGGLPLGWEESVSTRVSDIRDRLKTAVSNGQTESFLTQMRRALKLEDDLVAIHESDEYPAIGKILIDAGALRGLYVDCIQNSTDKSGYLSAEASGILAEALLSL